MHAKVFSYGSHGFHVHALFSMHCVCMCLKVKMWSIHLQRHIWCVFSCAIPLAAIGIPWQNVLMEGDAFSAKNACHSKLQSSHHIMANCLHIYISARECCV